MRKIEEPDEEHPAAPRESAGGLPRQRRAAPSGRRVGRPRAEAARATPPTRERILDAATELFARHGLQGVSMRTIAAGVGLDVSSVHHHFPTKSGLYDACFARVFAAERAALEPVVERAAEAVRGAPRAQVVGALHELVDAFVDFLDAHPHTTFLWLRRWLDPARDTALDASYALPLYQHVERVLLEAASRGAVIEPTPHVTVRSLVWAAHGHVTAVCAGGADAAAVAREQDEFRAYTHRLIDRLYADPGADDGEHP